MARARLLLISCVVLFLCAAVYLPKRPTGNKTAEPGAISFKPDVPLDIVFSTEGPVVVGEPIVVTCEVTPRIAAPLCSVELRLPAAVKVTAGSAFWEGPLAREASTNLTTTVELTESRRSVIAVLAGIHFSDGSRVYTSREIVLSPPGALKAAPAPSPVVTRNGARLIEHRGVER